MPSFQHRDNQLHYLDINDSGSDRAVLLLHGLGSRAAHWQPQLEALSPHYRVIAPDSCGHGDSSWQQLPQSVAELTDDVLALLDHLQLQQVDIIGYSLGGMVAFDLACHQPQRLRSLAVINSTPHMPADYPAVRALYWQRALTIRLFGLKLMARKVAKGLFPKAGQEAHAQQFIDSMAAMNRKPYLATLRAITRWSVLDQIAAIQQPTLVVTADQDYTPVDAKRAYCEMIPTGELVVIEHSTHATPMDQPEQLNHHLLTFLARADSH